LGQGDDIMHVQMSDDGDADVGRGGKPDDVHAEFYYYDVM